MASVRLDSIENLTEPHHEMHNSIHRTCLIFPPMINSVGIWGYLQNTENNPLVYALPRLELQILLAFFVTHSLHFIFKRIGLPIFVSQLLTGLILGTAVQNMNEDFQKIKLSFGSEEILDVTASFGFTLFIFLMGLKMDLIMVFRTGKRTFITGVMSLLVPLLMGLVALEKVASFWELDKEDKLKIYRIVLFNSMTSYLAIACSLSEIKILNSELGRLGLSTALVSDILSLFLTSSSTFVRAVHSRDIALPILNATLLIAFVAVALGFLEPVPGFLRRTKAWVLRSPGAGFFEAQALGSSKPRRWVPSNPRLASLKNPAAGFLKKPRRGFEETQRLGFKKPTLGFFEGTQALGSLELAPGFLQRTQACEPSNGRWCLPSRV
ncbi:hypothetical protein SLEP1_g32195 [Rubroshorea leprosula]|uniref:Cation/H+ exchanger transmembrane domain-containing protein n=1 Tax=Rubroshorea leprosula TaxID=152421 RepID=A0AAV5KCH8_9ROSI|nr:hypothetical protein SLEP1_g32195 [Rubroshorea leprosula]